MDRPLTPFPYTAEEMTTVAYSFNDSLLPGERENSMRRQRFRHIRAVIYPYMIYRYPQVSWRNVAEGVESRIHAVTEGHYSFSQLRRDIDNHVANSIPSMFNLFRSFQSIHSLPNYTDFEWRVFDRLRERSGPDTITPDPTPPQAVEMPDWSAEMEQAPPANQNRQPTTNTRRPDVLPLAHPLVQQHPAQNPPPTPQATTNGQFHYPDARPPTRSETMEG